MLMRSLRNTNEIHFIPFDMASFTKVCGKKHNSLIHYEFCKATSYKDIAAIFLVMSLSMS